MDLYEKNIPPVKNIGTCKSPQHLGGRGRKIAKFMASLGYNNKLKASLPVLHSKRISSKEGHHKGSRVVKEMIEYVVVMTFTYAIPHSYQRTLPHKKRLQS